MNLPAAIIRWLAGWIELARHDAVPGYAGHSRLARLRLDLAALGAALLAPGTWFALLLAVAVQLGASLVVWQFDFAGWQRDALLCLPAVLVAPWVAAGRRRHLGRLLARRATALNR